MACAMLIVCQILIYCDTIRHINKHLGGVMNPVFQSSYLGNKVAVYPNRIEYSAVGSGSQSIPIDQISGVKKGMMGMYQVVIETTGGKTHKITTSKKNEVVDAIYQAIENKGVDTVALPDVDKTASTQTGGMNKYLKWGMVVFGILVVIGLIAGDGEAEPAQNTPEATNEDTTITVDDTDSEYVKEVLAINDNVQSAMSTISQLSDRPTAVWTDDEFRAEIVIAMALIKASNQQAQKLVAPPEYSEVDMEYKAGMALYERSVDKLADGIDNVDADTIYEAVDLIQQGNDKIRSATQLLSEIDPS